MAQSSTSIVEALQECNSSCAHLHEDLRHAYKLSPAELSRTAAAEERYQGFIKDTYDIKHGLSDHRLRILLKIVAKDLPDCGRKRGAILRYIDAYDKPLDETGYCLYRKLSSLP
jgi:phage tail protein X